MSSAPPSGTHEVGRVLVVRHHLEDDAGLLGEAFEALGYSLTTVMVDAQSPPPSPDDYDAVVLLGSNESVYDEQARRDWFDHELAFMERADDQGVAMLGVCFGAQALCTLFGGEVRRGERGEHGWFDIDVEPGRDLARGPWFEYHHDHCLLPESADVWARTPRAVQAFSVRRHLGVQFHPEVDEIQLARWFDSESDVPRARSERQSALLEETRRETPAARVRAAALVATFLAHSRRP